MHRITASLISGDKEFFWRGRRWRQEQIWGQRWRDPMHVYILLMHLSGKDASLYMQKITLARVLNVQSSHQFPNWKLALKIHDQKGWLETLNHTSVTQWCLLKLTSQFVIRDRIARLQLWRRHDNFVNSPRTLDGRRRPRWTRPCPWLGDSYRGRSSKSGRRRNAGPRDWSDTVFSGRLVTTFILLFSRVILCVFQSCN